MNRLLVAAVVGLLATSVAVADIPPPPPPKGKKYVSVNNEVVLGKDVTGFVFVKQVTNLPPRGKPVSTKLELTPGKATAIPEPARRTNVMLFAVPQDTAKEFKSDEELFDALVANKVKSAHRIGFSSSATVSDKVAGNSVKWTTTITGIDKDGIAKKIEGEGYEPPAKRPKGSPKNGGEEEEESVGDPEIPGDTVSAARAPLVAGVALFAAITLGGLWVVGRGKRKA